MILAERPDRTRCTSRCWWTSAPMPRSCSAAVSACSPARARPAPPSRVRRSAAASAPRPAPSSACASIRATLEPRYKVIGSDLWSDDPAFAAATARTGRHRRLRLRHHRGDRRDVPRRHHQRQDGVIDGDRATQSDRVVADGRTFSYVLHRGDVPMKHHAERRARDPAREGRAARGRPLADGQAGG